MIRIQRLKKKYKELNLPVRAALWFTVCQFLQKGINMVTTPVFTRLLSTSEYGIASTYGSWSEVFVIIICLSTWRGILNLYKDHSDKDRVLTSVLSLSVTISITWFAILIILFPVLKDIIQIPFLLYLGAVVSSASQNIIVAWTVRKQYDYVYKPIITVTMINTIVSSVGGALLVAFVSRSAEGRIIPQILCTVGTAIVILFIYWRKYGLQIDKKIWIFCLSFAIPLLPHYLSEVVLHSSDRIMINAMCGSSDVAIYSVAYSVGSLVLLVASSINSVFAPYQYQQIKAQEYRKLATHTDVIIGFIALCCCGLIMFSREIVLIFGGLKYVDSIIIVVPIAMGVFYNYLFQIFARVQEYYEEKHTIVIASLSCAGLNLLLNYIFIPIFGFSAAAYTTLFCYFTFCFLHYVFYRRVCIKNIGHEIYDIKGLVIISVAFSGVAVAASFVDKIPILKYILLLMALLICLVKKNDIIVFIKKMKKG